MEIDLKQLYDLVLANQKSIEELRLEIVEVKNNLKYWVLLGAVLAIPYAIIVHRYLHPTERLFERKMAEVDALIKRAEQKLSSFLF